MTDRMPPIPREQWTEAQANAAAEFARMRGQDVFGPFALMLRSPEVMLRAAAMGDHMRYKTVLPPALNEFVILLVARHWSQQFEWHVHQPSALKAGLSEQIVAAVAKGHRPDAMSNDETIVYAFATAAAIALIASAVLLAQPARRAPVTIQLLALNDFHGSLEPPSGGNGRVGTVIAGGAAYLATHLKRAVADNPNSLVVAAGDVIGAAPLISSLVHNEPAIEALNAMHLAVSSVGNHEFDGGWQELVR